MKARLIVNPVSGGSSAGPALAQVNQRLRSAYRDLNIVMTTGPGDAGRAAEEAASAGYERLFVGGGDGTLNEVLNGVGRVGDGALERVVLGLVPLGTANDFATALGLPPVLEEALAVLDLDHVVTVDLGDLDGRLFVNVSGGGFMAEASDRLSPQLKAVAGRFAYIISGAQALLDSEKRTVSIRAEGAGQMVERTMSVQLFAVCNSPRAGGGRAIAPAARINDGLLDAIFIESMPTGDFLGALTRLADEESPDDPRVVRFQAGRIDLSFDSPIKVNTDGEVLEVTTCRYKVLPGAAHFLAGPDLH